MIVYQQSLPIFQLNRLLRRYPHDYIKQQPMTNFNMSQPPGRTYRYYTGFSVVLVLVVVVVVVVVLVVVLVVVVVVISIGMVMAAAVFTRA